MADMANDLSKNPRVYERLSFRVYDCQRPRLDTEWLLSTLFDASLLSTSKAAGNGGSFFARAKRRAFFATAPPLGNHKKRCRWTLRPERAMICSA
jgi:hypothetical protein